MDDSLGSRREEELPALARVLRNLLLAAGALSVLAFLVTAWMRLPYVYELEWAEGGILEHVRRVLAGQPIYVEPSLSFTPFEYTPLYYWVAAGAAKVLGAGFFPLRLVSVAASLGSFLVILDFVRRETRSAFYGFVSGSLFLATYPFSWAWYDLARVDALMVFFLVLAVYVLRFGRTIPTALLSGALMSLAFLTKQSALIFAVPLMVWGLAMRPRRRGIVFSLTFLGILFVTTVVGDRLTDGWYSFYAFDLVQQHGMRSAGFFGFWQYDMQPLMIALIFAASGLLAALAAKRWNDFAFLLALVASGIATGWSARMHPGSVSNVLIPTYAVTAMLFGIGLQACLSAVCGQAASTAPSGKAERRHWGVSALYAACVVQFALTAYSPLLLAPSAEEEAAGDEFVKRVAGIEGEVFIPYHGYLARLAGKEPQAHALAMVDVLRGTDERARDRLMSSISDALRQKRFAAIISESFYTWDNKYDLLAYFPEEMKGDYENGGDLFNLKGTIRTVSGRDLRRQLLYLPKP